MAHAATLKVFETLRQEFDEKKATKIAEALELSAESSEDKFVTKEFLKAELAEAKTEIIKWMFIFWAGHTLTVVGIVIAIIKYLK